MTRTRIARVMPKVVTEIRRGYVLFCTDTDKFMTYTPYTHPSFFWVDETRYLINENIIDTARCVLRTSSFQAFLGEDNVVLVPTVGYYGPDLRNKAGDGTQRDVFFEIDFRHSFDMWKEIPKIKMAPVLSKKLKHSSKMFSGLKLDGIEWDFTKGVSPHNRLDSINILDKWAHDSPHFDLNESNVPDND